MKAETEIERKQRHQSSLEAYRALVDPANAPRQPFIIEHHFFASDEANITGFTDAAEAKGFRVECIDYDPDNLRRTWSIAIVKLDLLEERRILALSDEMDALGREYDVIYDGWLTRVE